MFYQLHQRWTWAYNTTLGQKCRSAVAINTLQYEATVTGRGLDYIERKCGKHCRKESQDGGSLIHKKLEIATCCV